MFKKIRNTNYLGELFIYLGFSLLATDWFPIICLFLIILVVWVPNMIKIDKSLARYPDFKEYKKDYENVLSNKAILAKMISNSLKIKKSNISSISIKLISITFFYKIDTSHI